MTETTEPSVRIYETIHQFAAIQLAYKECSDGVRSIVDRLLPTCLDNKLEIDERQRAYLTILDALFPATMEDWVSNIRKEMKAEKQIQVQLESQTEYFAKQVKKFMRKRGMTQADLAEAIGVGQPAVSMLLRRNCRPQIRTVKKIAKALGVPLGDLWIELG